jgi:hypothetical protein
LALAQPDPSCVRSNQDTRATGTVLGALGGAVLGSVIAGRHDRGVGAVGGAVAGGVAGNVLAGQHNDPCPDGYYRPAPPPPPQYGPPPPPPPGYYRDGPPPPPPGPVSFWRDAPGGIHERIDFLDRRLRDAQAQGNIGNRDARAAWRELGDIRNQERDLRYRGGGELSPQDRSYLQSRLDELSRRIHWQTHY